jgi:translation initiation factor 1 (eIF-1/SUI1)
VKRKMASRVTIKRVERNKKKYVTAVMGLEAFGGSNQSVLYIPIDREMSRRH